MTRNSAIPEEALVIRYPEHVAQAVRNRLSWSQVVFGVLFGVSVMSVAKLLLGWLSLQEFAHRSGLMLGYMMAYFLGMSAYFLWKFSSVWKQRKLAKALTGLQVWLSPSGVGYACNVGVFSAPWSSVVRVALTGRPGGVGKNAQILRLEATGWEGPLRTLKSQRLWLEATGWERPLRTLKKRPSVCISLATANVNPKRLIDAVLAMTSGARVVELVPDPPGLSNVGRIAINIAILFLLVGVLGLRFVMLDSGRYQPLSDCPTLADDTMRQFGVTGPLVPSDRRVLDGFVHCSWKSASGNPSIELSVDVSNKGSLSAPASASDKFKQQTKLFVESTQLMRGHAEPVSGVGDEAVVWFYAEGGVQGFAVRTSNAVIFVLVQDSRLFRLAASQQGDEFVRFRARAVALYSDVARNLQPR
jgi:hypothetical protein